MSEIRELLRWTAEFISTHPILAMATVVLIYAISALENIFTGRKS